MNTIESEIAALRGLSAHELRAAWRRLNCGEPIAGSSRDLMLREIAYRIQERAHGGLAPSVKRRMGALAEELTADGSGRPAPLAALKPGTRLMREWGGRTHTVIVLDEGFEYDGKHHRSLTRIAQRITGAHWSGPRFFGLRKTAAKLAEAAGADHE